MKKAWVLSYPLSALRRLIRLGGCPGWSESLLGAQSFCGFCHEGAHMWIDIQFVDWHTYHCCTKLTINCRTKLIRFCLCIEHSFWDSTTVFFFFFKWIIYNTLHSAISIWECRSSFVVLLACGSVLPEKKSKEQSVNYENMRINFFKQKIASSVCVSNELQILPAYQTSKSVSIAWDRYPISPWVG